MKERKVINCVITDLDDTIWNWLEMWHSSFKPYFDDIVKSTKVNPDVLKADFKNLHQKYGTTEVSFAFNELTSLSAKQKEEITKKPITGKSILHKYYSNKKRNLNSYNGVLDTLKKLKEQGVLIIGFTESNAFFTKTRIKHLDLDGVFDCIYTPVDSGIPENTIRYYPENYWEPKLTEIRHLSKYDRKPNKEILEIILRDFKLKKEQTIYIGDKLDRDIQMAIDTGVTSVYASYGHIIENEKYELLKAVTHWNDDDVKREIEFKEKLKNKEIEPDYKLINSYDEILNYFRFKQNDLKLNIELLPNVIAVWNKITDVQQHFNDIALKIRNLALTTFTFIIAGIGFLFKENLSFIIFNYYIPVSAIFSILGALIIWVFYFMDKHWYHKFLVGSVKQSSKIENKWNKIFPEIGLSNSISKESNYNFEKFGIRFKSNSNRRFIFFYRPLIWSLVIITVLLFIFNQHQKSVSYKFYEQSIKQNKVLDIDNKDLKIENELLKKALKEKK
ncbi:HAD hydrolase-like protein [Flavobacterium sp. 123]|uniref:HAD hydrolase-like protein n=1 Tax=Flavobacterium sp. 123 TaxID=2135627 RepID=UPI000EB07634|nr:HAD hydrolase-like protein [Flavobacterium sp. 123]RKT00187.1 phosphoglycolate phosphatase-like HAD superfamily hydrolase [Flavobacterium sp. 123]